MSEHAALCPYCGAPNKPGATVCEYCEKPLTPAAKPTEELQQYFEEDTTGPSQSSGQYDASSRYSEENQYGSSVPGEKSKLVAGLLALFLGTFGIHKFYLGYRNEGFIMLGGTLVGGIISGLIPSAIALIALAEGIIYLCKSNEDFDRIYVQNKKEWF